MTSKFKKKLRRVLHSTFYRVYFALVLLCVVGIGFGARWLSEYLADYEAAQPAHVAENALKMFEDGDYETVYNYDTSAPKLASGDQAYYVKNMREIANGKAVSWTEAYSPDADERRYSVLLDDEKFAEMALVPSGNVTRHGQKLWKLDSVTTFVTMGEQEEPEPEEEPEPTGILCHVTVPSESAVTVDGAPLTAEDAVTSDIPTASAGLLPKGVPSPTLTEYAFYSESGEPQIEVTDKFGNAQEVTAGEEYSWSCALPESPELKEQFEGPVVQIAEMIAQVAARIANKNDVLRRCAPDSPAYANIEAFDLNSGYKHRASKFENVETSNYYQYSDDCFSCHVSFDYLSWFSADVIKTYPTTMTLYFVRQGGSGKLYNFTFY